MKIKETLDKLIREINNETNIKAEFYIFEKSFFVKRAAAFNWDNLVIVYINKLKKLSELNNKSYEETVKNVLGHEIIHYLQDNSGIYMKLPKNVKKMINDIFKEMIEYEKKLNDNKFKSFLNYLFWNIKNQNKISLAKYLVRPLVNDNTENLEFDSYFYNYIQRFYGVLIDTSEVLEAIPYVACKYRDFKDPAMYLITFTKPFIMEMFLDGYKNFMQLVFPLYPLKEYKDKMTLPESFVESLRIFNEHYLFKAREYMYNLLKQYKSDDEIIRIAKEAPYLSKIIKNVEEFCPKLSNQVREITIDSFKRFREKNEKILERKKEYLDFVKSELYK